MRKPELTTLFIVIFLVIIFHILFSCSSDKGPYFYDVEEPCLCDTSEFNDPDCDCDTLEPNRPLIVSYKNDIQPILDQYCISCHNETDQYADMTSDYSHRYLNLLYVDKENPQNSELYLRITGANAIMPVDPPYLTENEIAMVLLWIEQGAENN